MQHYLHDEPVSACPPSRWYRFRKLARRNKRALVTTSALLVGALLAVISLARSNVLIRREQARTNEAKERAEAAQELAEQRAGQIRDSLERLKTAGALVDRSRTYVAASRWDDAQASLTKAVELRPDLAGAWAELANLYARLGLWQRADDALGRELELRPPDTPSRWYFHALLRLWLGDTAGYRRVSSRMREHFRGTSSPLFLFEVVRASALRPDADADLGHWVELARFAVAHRDRREWGVRYVLGLAHYRAGQHEQAVRRLRESLAGGEGEWTLRTFSYPVLAMAYYRLGQTAEARKALQAAARALDHWAEAMYRGGDGHWVIHLGAAAYWPVTWWDWLEGRLYYREARLLIDGCPPPDDPRLHVLRARAFAGLREHAAADAEYALAARQRPHDPQVQLELHRNRGYWGIDRGRWGQAAAEFDQANELRPDVHLGLFGAVAHLQAGEVEAYQRACAALVQRFGKTQDLEEADDVLRACVLRPGALPDVARLLPLARVATPAGDPGPTEAGAALYRAGRYAEAVRCFEEAARVHQLRARAWCFLAMARHGLRRTAAARQALAEAARWIEAANRAELDDPTASRPAWGGWYEKLECDLLFAEARRLMGLDSTDGRPRRSPTMARVYLTRIPCPPCYPAREILTEGFAPAGCWL